VRLRNRDSKRYPGVWTLGSGLGVKIGDFRQDFAKEGIVAFDLGVDVAGAADEAGGSQAVPSTTAVTGS